MKILRFLVPLVFVFNSVWANDYSITLGVGPAWSTPGTVRAGFNHWEVGLLASGIVGVSKMFSSGVPYFAFGPAIISGGTASFGFYGSVGFKNHLFWNVHSRLELFSAVSFASYSVGGGIAGLTFVF